MSAILDPVPQNIPPALETLLARMANLAKTLQGHLDVFAQEAAGDKVVTPGKKENAITGQRTDVNAVGKAAHDLVDILQKMGDHPAVQTLLSRAQEISTRYHGGDRIKRPLSQAVLDSCTPKMVLNLIEQTRRAVPHFVDARTLPLLSPEEAAEALRAESPTPRPSLREAGESNVATRLKSKLSHHLSTIKAELYKIERKIGGHEALDGRRTVMRSALSLLAENTKDVLNHVGNVTGAIRKGQLQAIIGRVSTITDKGLQDVSLFSIKDHDMIASLIERAGYVVRYDADNLAQMRHPDMPPVLKIVVPSDAPAATEVSTPAAQPAVQEEHPVLSDAALAAIAAAQANTKQDLPALDLPAAADMARTRGQNPLAPNLVDLIEALSILHTQYGLYAAERIEASALLHNPHTTSQEKDQATIAIRVAKENQGVVLRELSQGAAHAFEVALFSTHPQTKLICDFASALLQAPSDAETLQVQDIAKFHDMLVALQENKIYVPAEWSQHRISDLTDGLSPQEFSDAVATLERTAAQLIIARHHEEDADKNITESAIGRKSIAQQMKADLQRARETAAHYFTRNCAQFIQETVGFQHPVLKHLRDQARTFLTKFDHIDLEPADRQESLWKLAMSQVQDLCGQARALVTGEPFEPRGKVESEDKLTAEEAKRAGVSLPPDQLAQPEDERVPAPAPQAPVPPEEEEAPRAPPAPGPAPAGDQRGGTPFAGAAPGARAQPAPAKPQKGKHGFLSHVFTKENLKNVGMAAAIGATVSTGLKLAFASVALPGVMATGAATSAITSTVMAWHADGKQNPAAPWYKRAKRVAKNNWGKILTSTALGGVFGFAGAELIEYLRGAEVANVNVAPERAPEFIQAPEASAPAAALPAADTASTAAQVPEPALAPETAAPAAPAEVAPPAQNAAPQAVPSPAQPAPAPQGAAQNLAPAPKAAAPMATPPAAVAPTLPTAPHVDTSTLIKETVAADGTITRIWGSAAYPNEYITETIQRVKEEATNAAGETTKNMSVTIGENGEIIVENAPPEIMNEIARNGTATINLTPGR